MHATSRAKWSLAVASLMLSLLSVELVFRLWGLRGEFFEPRRDELLLSADTTGRMARFGFVPHATIRSHYDSDPRGYFDAGSVIDHEFNSAGWRDVERTVEKPANTFRILGLGDSYLFGQGVRREDICLSRLEHSLQEGEPNARIETINAGLSSLNTAQQRDILLHEGLRYEPDLVIVHFVLNDVEKAEELFLKRPKVEFTESYVAIYNRPDALSRLSYFWGWARQRVLRYVVGQTYIEQCVQSFRDEDAKWQQCRAALADIAKITRERDINLLVVIFPFFIELNGDYPFQEIHDQVRGFCREQEIACLDLRDTYAAYSGPELWVHPTDQHPNELAHKLAAQAMASYLQEVADWYLPTETLQRKNSRP